MTDNHSTALEYRTFDAARIETRVRDKSQGIIDVRSNVCDQVDSYTSVFDPGCWDRAVAAQGYKPYFFLDHEPDKQIGRATETGEKRDASGIWQLSTIRVNLEKQMAREALSDIEERFREFYSHGFASDRATERFEQRDGQTVRRIVSLKAWPDISSVLVPGGSGTATLSVRASGLLAPAQRTLTAPATHTGIIDPSADFDDIRLVTEHRDGRTYGAQYGHRAGQGWTLAQISYPAQTWTATEARAHCLAAGGHEFSEALGAPRSDTVGLTTPERRDAPEGSYEDLSQDLHALINTWLGGNWQDWEDGRSFWINHTMPGYVVAEITGLPGTDAGSTLLSFPYTIGADGEPTLSGDPTEVTAEYVPVEPGARSAAIQSLKKEAGINDAEGRSLSGPAETASAALDTARRKLRLASYALATLGVEPSPGHAPEVRHDSMSRRDKTQVQAMHDQAGGIHTATAALGAAHSPDTCGMDAA